MLAYIYRLFGYRSRQRIVIEFWPGHVDGVISVRTRSHSAADLATVLALAMTKSEALESAVLTVASKWREVQEIAKCEGL